MRERTNIGWGLMAAAALATTVMVLDSKPEHKLLDEPVLRKGKDPRLKDWERASKRSKRRRRYK